ncbi:bifunctional enoyl-CoA hydratase/phosphate acetyltransferase [Lawsonibacter sp. LCP25S3_G6]|uniref:bifunctional enoyl-CoA hydratase/phosphate acetyltransferase n=1 Tax=unclassified Lawsonibacter TaxID=2617946 RepID=UPI003F9DDD87
MKEKLHDLPVKRAVVAAAHDEHTLQAVFAARRDGFIRPVLVGEREEIFSIARHLGEKLEADQVVQASGEQACAEQAVALIREGQGELLIKGMLQTGTMLKAVVSKEKGIRRSQVMSHVAILDVPSYHKLLFITDGGMVVAPDLEQKRHILKNAVEFCHFLGYERPKAAALCAVETVTAAMPETQDAARLKEEGAQGEFGPCEVEGPISLDLATDREAARTKHYESPVAGDADILLVPAIAVGNVLGKALYGLAGGEMAGVVLGAQVPITVNSRGASAQEKYWSILISAAMGGLSQSI